MRVYETVVPEALAGSRLDQALMRLVPELSRRKAKVALDVGCVFVGRRRVKVAGRRLREGEHLSVTLGAPYEAELAGRPPLIPDLEVLFEDAHLVVVNKPSGMHSVPTREGDRGTLAWLLETRTTPRRALHVVHRLDMPTSGILVFAKTVQAKRELAERFKTHDLVRRYDTFVSGSWPETAGLTEFPVGGKPARTQFRVVRYWDFVTQLEAELETGRTHQIRLHAQRVGHPVLGDLKYGTKTNFDPPRLALHARVLQFEHPVTGRSLSFESPLPQDLATWVDKLSSRLEE